MTDRLKAWLREVSPRLCATAARRIPNLLLDDHAVEGFLSLLMTAVDEEADVQIAAIQSWARTNIGADAQLANDWLPTLRLLKETIGEALRADFPPAQALEQWWRLDPLFNHALIEATRLASQTDRATHLAHMVKLREQMNRLERSKTNFVSVAAHELKTPLTILEGYAAILRDEIPRQEEQLHQLLDGLGKGTERLRSVIDDMLDVTLIDAESLDMNFQVMYVEKVVGFAAERLEAAFSERDVALAVEPQLLRYPILGDPERLRQVFHKIMENALKYTPAGGRVTVSSAVVREDEATSEIAGYIDVQVADTGIGIDPDNLSTIFDKFATTHDISLHSSGKTKFKGRGPGLGLSIARGIVEAHGGRVWAESPGCDEDMCPGSTFHVELPIRRRLLIETERPMPGLRQDVGRQHMEATYFSE